MFDTVILEIIISLAAIINRKRFKPEINDWILNQSGFKKFKNNPTKEDKRKWEYLPRLTAYQRGRILVLKNEFSVPNLLFGDNTNEFTENDLENAVNRLKETTEKMGVLLTSEQIRKAGVLEFHSSKNIILNNCYNPSLVNRELRKADISRKFDIDYKEYRNGGEVLQFYSDSNALCLYDKVRDSKRPPKRAFDKDQTDKQSSLFKNLTKQIEILRIESRWKKEKFKDIFEKIGYANFNPTFENLFNRDLHQKILKHHWSYFINDNLFLFDMRNSPQKILNLVLAKYKDKKIPLYKLFGLVGFILCSKDEEGTIGLRNILNFYKPKNNWSKTKKWLEDYKKDLDKSYLHGFIKDIESQLDEFKPFRVEIKP